MRRICVMVPATAVLVLAGCATETVTYRLTPPATPDAKACVDKCGEQRKTCEEDSRSRFGECQIEYKEKMAIYTRCRNSSSAGPGSQFACELPRACTLPTPEQCDQPYRACFEACGGKVEEIRGGEPQAKTEPTNQPADQKADQKEEPAPEADKQ